MALGVGGGRGTGSGHGVPLQDPPAVLQHDARAAVVVVVQQHALPVALAVLPSALFELPDEQFINSIQFQFNFICIAPIHNRSYLRAPNISIRIQKVKLQKGSICLRHLSVNTKQMNHFE